MLVLFFEAHQLQLFLNGVCILNFQGLQWFITAGLTVLTFTSFVSKRHHSLTTCHFLASTTVYRLPPLFFYSTPPVPNLAFLPAPLTAHCLEEEPQIPLLYTVYTDRLSPKKTTPISKYRDAQNRHIKHRWKFETWLLNK